MEDPQVRAEDNLYALSKIEYIGRGFVMGPSKDAKHLAQIYWLEGRSENSRNRVLTADGGRVFTEAADPTKVKDPSLIIYNAMNEADGNFIVSNGDQTDAVLEELRNRWYRWPWRKRGWHRFLQAVEKHTYEPDKPNFTSRITGICSLEPVRLVGVSVLRKADWNHSCIPFHSRYSSLPHGIGVCVTTYSGQPIIEEGGGLPPYRGEPLLMPLVGDMKTLALTYWDMLNANNRVALVVKFIDQTTRTSQVHIINKYAKQLTIPC